MGGAVSAGRDNNELIDNLMSGNYIRTREIERVFRALDRADFMTPEARDQAYKDVAWRNGPLHMSSPCIYSEVMEGLELRPGLSFLNVGSGTGYLSTLAGLILGTPGISHGVELHPAIVEYAVKKISQFIENSPTMDDFDFCEPKFYQGNGLCLSPLQSEYDRVYCGAACPERYENYFKRLIKVGGILVMPLNDTLLQVRRVSETKWTSRSLLNVSFATLIVPASDEAAEHVKLDKQTPVRLQFLARSVVRAAMRLGVIRRHPELREKPRPPPPAACPRRICIPLEPSSAVEGLNVLHDLDTETGANEMNALLSLVITMGERRVAGALRFNRIIPSDSSDDEREEREPAAGPQEPAGPRDAAGNEGDERPSDDSRPEEVSSAIADDKGLYGPNYVRDDSDADDKTNSGDRGANETRTDTNGTTDCFRRPDTVRLPGRRESARKHSSDLDDAKPDDGSDYKRRSKSRKPDSGSSNNCRKSVRQSQLDQHFYSGSTDPLFMSLYDINAGPSTSNEKVKNRATANATDCLDMNIAPSTAENGNNNSDSNDIPPKPALPGVPSEVEIDLAKMAQTESNTVNTEMEWEESRADALEASEDETDTSKSNAKRQKLDSGIGENTPSTSSCTSSSRSGPSSEKTKSEDSDTESQIHSDSLTDDAEGSRTGSVRDRSPSYWSPSPEELQHQARQMRRIARGGDARRVRLSVLMKQAVRELPLPHALKKFVNLGRCFEF